MAVRLAASTYGSDVELMQNSPVDRMFELLSVVRTVKQVLAFQLISWTLDREHDCRWVMGHHIEPGHRGELG